MTFPLEKILTISSEKYCESRMTTVAKYDFIGVQVEGRISRSVTDLFAKNVPNNAEVVVDYKVVIDKKYGANAYGTALIPKRKI